MSIPQFLHLLALSESKGYNCLHVTFEEKVKFLRNLPQFKVAPISEVKAIAFVAREEHGKLYLESEDIEKIVGEYPNLASKLGRGRLTPLEVWQQYPEAKK